MQENNKDNKGGNNKKIFISILVFALISTFLMNLLTASYAIRSMREVEYSKFLEMIEKSRKI